jgi:hypothetical protein
MAKKTSSSKKLREKITLDADFSSLKNGIYFNTLLINGSAIDMKRMLIIH